MVDVIPRLRAMTDPADWGTGLHPDHARLVLREELDLLERDFPSVPSSTRRVWIWCSSNVFTAPLRWAAMFTRAGCELTLKAPSACPEPVRQLGLALGARVFEGTHDQALDAVSAQADAVLGFGGDEAMSALDRRLPEDVPRSLHGHRVSFAIAQGDGPGEAEALSWDATLFDGRGCMSPAAIFCLGDAARLASHLASALAERALELPRGQVGAHVGPIWRRRLGLARVFGRVWSGPDWAVPLLPASRAEAHVLPRMLPVHPIGAPAELEGLRRLPLSTCATDLAVRPDLPFPRWTGFGQMQRPRMGPWHEGVHILDTLLE